MFVVLFLNSNSTLQTLQMATFLLATVLSSLLGEPNCSHNTLFKVLLGTIHELQAAISLLHYYMLGLPQCGKSHSKIPVLVHTIRLLY